MAKIGARGDHEVARWRNERGDEFLLTKNGRLLQKYKGGSWKQYAKLTKDSPLMRVIKTRYRVPDEELGWLPEKLAGIGYHRV